MRSFTTADTCMSQPPWVCMALHAWSEPSQGSRPVYSCSRGLTSIVCWLPRCTGAERVVCLLAVVIIVVLMLRQWSGAEDCCCRVGTPGLLDGNGPCLGAYAAGSVGVQVHSAVATFALCADGRVGCHGKSKVANEGTLLLFLSRADRWLGSESSAFSSDDQAPRTAKAAATDLHLTHLQRSCNLDMSRST